jgi:hypothetical protein
MWFLDLLVALFVIRQTKLTFIALCVRYFSWRLGREAASGWLRRRCLLFFIALQCTDRGRTRSQTPCKRFRRDCSLRQIAACSARGQIRHGPNSFAIFGRVFAFILHDAKLRNCVDFDGGFWEPTSFGKCPLICTVGCQVVIPRA